MIRLDTIRLSMPAEECELDAAAVASHPEAAISTKARAERPYDRVTIAGNDALGFGLSRLVHERISDHVALEFSAKLLGNDFLDGITLDNLDAVASALNGRGLLHVTPEGLLAAGCTRADAGINLPGTREGLADDFDALRSLRLNPKWGISVEGRRRQSLRWKRTSTYKLRAYDKEADTWKAANKGFRDSLNSATLAKLPGMIRVEREAQGPKNARALASVAVHETVTDLGTILASDRPAVAETFAEVHRPGRQADLFDRAARYADEVRDELGIKQGPRLFNAVLRRFGLWAIVVEAEGDMEAVRQIVRQYVGGNAYQFYPEAEAACYQFQTGAEGQRLSRIRARLDDFAARLRAAEGSPVLHR